MIISSSEREREDFRASLLRSSRLPTLLVLRSVLKKGKYVLILGLGYSKAIWLATSKISILILFVTSRSRKRASIARILGQESHYKVIARYDTKTNPSTNQKDFPVNCTNSEGLESVILDENIEFIKTSRIMFHTYNSHQINRRGPKPF